MSRITDEFRILHVDDDPALVALSAELLPQAESRLTVETMTDPTEAAAAIAETRYDAVVTDYLMPELSGLELLEKIRETCELPVIIFTGEGREDVASEALTLGANRYLQKGGDPSTQYDVLADALVHEIEHARAKTSLQQYATAVESSDDSIYMLDTDGAYVFANAEHLSRLAADGKIGAVDETEVVGRQYSAIHTDRDNDHITDTLQTALERGEAITEEYGFETEDSWSYRTYSPVFDPESDDPLGVVVISKDITQRKRMEDHEAFLHSLLRHDVKNKVHAAHGYLELAEEHAIPTDAAEYLSTASRLLDDSMELIEKVGTLTELTQQDPEPWELHTVVSSVVDSYRSRAESAGIELSYDGCEGQVLGGPLLEALFGNLVENALRHANAETITVDCWRDDEMYVVTVEDDGDGLAAESTESVFQEGVSAGETAGTGLGLYLVGEIIESYGGSISLDEDNGLRVTVRLQAV